MKVIKSEVYDPWVEPPVTAVTVVGRLGQASLAVLVEAFDRPVPDWSRGPTEAWDRREGAPIPEVPGYPFSVNCRALD